MANADLTFAGNMKSAALSGDITVTRFGINQEFDFASYLTKGKEPPAAPNADSPLNNVHLDVHVSSTPELQLQTSLAKIAGTLDLRVRGTAMRPSLLGRVNIVEGEISFNGAKYHLERGDVSFGNPVRIEPVLNLEATATVREYDITLEFHGPMDKMKTNYRSDPPLPTGDIIALLALGRTRNETENAATLPGAQQQAPAFTESASNALLYQALNATVSSRMQKLFGVSRIKLDPQVGGPENNANARVTIEQQVSNKVTLTYISNLSQSTQQVIQFEYNVNRNVSILAVRDQNGIVGVEVRIRQRKK
jgi:translocation and assembly module TamB